MLVLTRKLGETIVVNNNVHITIVEIGPGRVKVGVKAPNDVTIDRLEIFEKKQAELAADAESAIPTVFTSSVSVSEATAVVSQSPKTVDFRRKSR